MPSAVNSGRMNTVSYLQNAQYEQLTTNHEAQTSGTSLTRRKPVVHIIPLIPDRPPARQGKSTDTRPAVHLCPEFRGYVLKTLWPVYAANPLKDAPAAGRHIQPYRLVARCPSIRPTSAEFDDRPTQFRRRRRNVVSHVKLSHFIEVSLRKSTAQFVR